MSQKTALHLTDQASQTASLLPPLLLAAEQLANTVVQGIHGRKKAGTGEAFWQYRLYGAGDSTARIDWRKSARSAHVYVRENEWEAANSLWLWTNPTADMDFKSKLSSVTKRDRAQLLLLALGALSLEAQERVGLLLPEERASHSRSTLFNMAVKLLNNNEKSPLPRPPLQLTRGIAVLFSDFYEPPEAIEATVRALAAQGLRGHLVQIFDPAEETLPYRGRVEFFSMDKSQHYLAGKTESLAPDYRKLFAKQRAFLQDLARRTGWGFSHHATSQPAAAPLLLALYQQLSPQRGGLFK